ncbi:MAG: sugar phosphate isomerase/epimerase, partial [Alphaproteobacteria bacterium]|nr:sugar phosphate isomerase/epimerase [Alphaproteobacteria bacterium]
MKLSICTDVMANLSFTGMLDKCVKLGVEGVEMTGGGWSGAPHFRADALLADKGLLKSKLTEISARGLEIAALNCSANPLDPGPMGQRHRLEMEQTIRLAGEIGVKKIVTMSGLPEAAPGDSVPNWLVYTK